MNGLPINYGPIAEFAKKHGVHLIADSAESLGGKYQGQQIGTQALAHSFSFFGNKNITTGEGGMVTTNEDWLAEELRILRNQGQQGRYNHTHLGFNYRMTEMQAAIGIIQLAGLNERLNAKRRIVRQYNEYFSTTDLILPPHIPDNVDHAWYMYPPSFDESVDRDQVVRLLAADNIETRTSFPPVHTQPYFQQRFSYKTDDYPVSMRAWQKLINLPISPCLKNLKLNVLPQQYLPQKKLLKISLVKLYLTYQRNYALKLDVIRMTSEIHSQRLLQGKLSDQVKVFALAHFNQAYNTLTVRDVFAALLPGVRVSRAMVSS